MIDEQIRDYPNKPNFLNIQKKQIKIQKYINKKVMKFIKSLYSVSLGSLLLNRLIIRSIIKYITIITSNYL